MQAVTLGGAAAANGKKGGFLSFYTKGEEIFNAVSHIVGGGLGLIFWAVLLVLSYPEWKVGDISVSLDKKISVYTDSHFCKVEDSYNFSGADSLTVAAGIFRHPEQQTIEQEHRGTDRYAIWEHASDQSIEPEDGMLGVAVYVPGCESVSVTEDGMHGLCSKSIMPGETFSYWFGSCWSKADIKTAEDWFALVDSLK